MKYLAVAIWAAFLSCMVGVSVLIWMQERTSAELYRLRQKHHQPPRVTPVMPRAAEWTEIKWAPDYRGKMTAWEIWTRPDGTNYCERSLRFNAD